MDIFNLIADLLESLSSVQAKLFALEDGDGASCVVHIIVEFAPTEDVIWTVYV